MNKHKRLESAALLFCLPAMFCCAALPAGLAEASSFPPKMPSDAIKREIDALKKSGEYKWIVVGSVEIKRIEIQAEVLPAAGDWYYTTSFRCGYKDPKDTDLIGSDGWTTREVRVLFDGETVVKPLSKADLANLRKDQDKRMNRWKTEPQVYDKDELK